MGSGFFEGPQVLSVSMFSSPPPPPPPPQLFEESSTHFVQLYTDLFFSPTGCLMSHRPISCDCTQSPFWCLCRRQTSACHTTSSAWPAPCWPSRLAPSTTSPRGASCCWTPPRKRVCWPSWSIFSGAPRRRRGWKVRVKPGQRWRLRLGRKKAPRKHPKRKVM